MPSAASPGTEGASIASHDPVSRALDTLFATAADLRVAAADIRPVTPAEHRQQRAMLALAARIRTDVARVGNECHEGIVGKSDIAPPPLAEAA